MNGNQASVDIINSPLSELGVMAFDFGYTVADSNSLVLWEGSFGDFVNGAQILIDQFLVASEAKWNRHQGLLCCCPMVMREWVQSIVLADLSDFCSCAVTLIFRSLSRQTAAQYFHILRRQIKREFRKPWSLCRQNRCSVMQKW